MNNRQIEIFKNLLSYAERNTCLHEETHRGGLMWEICDSCGRKWADDEGGKPEDAHEWPKEIEEAQNLLDSLDKESPEITYELPENDSREIKQWHIDKTENGYHVCLSIKEKMENFHCQPEKPWDVNKLGSTPKDMSEYEPETIAIPTLELQNIVDALEAGLEHTQTVLAEHDASLGRTTRQNKSWAEHLEKDIEFLKARIKLLKLKIVGATTHYP